MREPNVLRVRATSEGRFRLERSGPAAGSAEEAPVASAAEMAEAIRSLPESVEIRFINEGGDSVNLIAAANAALQRRPAPPQRVGRARRARSYMRLSQRPDGLYDIEVEPTDGSAFEVAGLTAAAIVERYLALGRYKFTCRDARGRLAIEQPPDDIARALEASGRGYGRESRCERCGDTGVTSAGPCAWCSVAIPPASDGRGPLSASDGF